jgi:DNA-directed RNA polymerase specialized sigma subunit
VIPLDIPGHNRPREGKKEDWVLLFEKKAANYLRPFGSFTQKEREFDHNPTRKEIAEKLHISREKLDECLDNGTVVIHGRRSEDSGADHKSDH